MDEILVIILCLLCVDGKIQSNIIVPLYIGSLKVSSTRGKKGQELQVPSAGLICYLKYVF